MRLLKNKGCVSGGLIPKAVFLTVFVLAMLLLAGMALAVTPAPAFERTYTSDADFSEGVEINVNHATVPDQLQLSEGTRTFSFIWIANADENTVSKIDTRTGQEVGRYLTGPPDGTGWSPSRTAVDQDGNCWVANRAFNGRASIVKILADDWVDKNSDGMLQTSVDADGNGVIDPSEILPWNQDERVAAFYYVGGGNGVARAIALDRYGYVWVGLWNESRYVKIDPDNGSELASVGIPGASPYGAVIDGQGILWSSTLSNILACFDTGAPPVEARTFYLPYGNYGICVDRAGKVWMGSNKLMMFDPLTETVSCFDGVGNVGRGVAVDRRGDIWMAKSDTNTVEKYVYDGTYLFSVPVGLEPIGVGVDVDGNIWAVNRSSNNATKIAPDGTVLGTYPTGNGPYSYSDMTGFNLNTITHRTGTWTTVVDSGLSNAPWGTVCWNAWEPEGTYVKVRVRSAEEASRLESAVWVPAENGLDFDVPNGRYLQVEAKLSTSVEVSPELYDLTVQTAVNQAVIKVLPAYWEAAQGDEVTVNISVYGVNNLYGAELVLNYNPSVLVIERPDDNVSINCTYNDGVFTVGDIVELNNQSGFIRLAATRTYNEYGYEGFCGDGVLATLKFRAVKNGDSFLNLTYVELRGNAGTEGSEVYLIPAGQENGLVRVTKGNIVGRVILEGVPASLQDYGQVSVYLKGAASTFLTGPDGGFSLSALEPGNYILVAYHPVYLRREIPFTIVEAKQGVDLGTILLLTGDISNNNVVDLSDLLQLKAVYGLHYYDGDFSQAADLNRNKRIDLVDLVLLARNYTKEGDGGIITAAVITRGGPPQPSSPGEYFLYRDFYVNVPTGAQVILCSHPDGTGNILVADHLYMYVNWWWWYCGGYYEHNFRNPDTGTLEILEAQDVTGCFQQGCDNHVQVYLYNYGEYEEFSTPLYLVTVLPCEGGGGGV